MVCEHQRPSLKKEKGHASLGVVRGETRPILHLYCLQN